MSQDRVIHQHPSAEETSAFLFNMRTAFRHMEAGDVEQAEAAYRLTFPAHPDYIDIHAELGTLLGEAIRDKEVERAYRRALRIKQDAIDAQADFATPEKKYPSGDLLVMKLCRHGMMLYFKNDSYIGRSLEIYGEYSEKEAAMFCQIVQPGQVVVEVGANIGTHTVYLAKRVGPTGRVIAYEPQRLVSQVLAANCALNELSNCVIRNAAAGGVAGFLHVPPIDFQKMQNLGGLALSTESDGEKVAVECIDSLDLPALHFLKVDVEGMEADVLRGAEQTIKRCRPILYMENDRRHKSAELISLVQSMEYTLFWHLPPLFNPNNFDGISENMFKKMVSSNMIATPKERDIKVLKLRQVTGPEDFALGA